MTEKHFEIPAPPDPQTSPEIGKYHETIRELQERLEKMRAEALGDHQGPHIVERRKEDGAREILKPRKKVICFIGLPGAGKSTQIKEIKEATGAETFHLVKVDGILHLEHSGNKKEVKALLDEKKRHGELLDVHGIDELFLSEVAKTESLHVILDGFPRSIPQAERLFEAAEREGWELQVIHLTFPEGREIEESFERQSKRAKEQKNQEDEAVFLKKMTRAVNKDMAALQAIRRIGVKLTEFDCAKSPQEISEEIRRALGLDFEPAK